MSTAPDPWCQRCGLPIPDGLVRLCPGCRAVVQPGVAGAGGWLPASLPPIVLPPAAAVRVVRLPPPTPADRAWLAQLADDAGNPDDEPEPDPVDVALAQLEAEREGPNLTPLRWDRIARRGPVIVDSRDVTEHVAELMFTPAELAVWQAEQRERLVAAMAADLRASVLTLAPAIAAGVRQAGEVLKTFAQRLADTVTMAFRLPPTLMGLLAPKRKVAARLGRSPRRRRPKRARPAALPPWHGSKRPGRPQRPRR